MNRRENVVKDAPTIAVSNGVWQGWALLVACLIATALAAYYTKSDADRDAKREFDFVSKEIQIKIQDRLSAHEQILRSGAAFYENSGSVSREDWCRFTERQNVVQYLPGIQGIGFALLIPPQNLAQHVQEIRAQGFPDYHVWPESKRETYSSIIYLEPFTNRNLRAFGYDMFSESVRRAAMERARDQDAASLSGKVVLVQETEKNVQAGTLMYVPVYRLGMPHNTIAQRRAALVGWVYSPYRMNDLMQGILGRWDLTGQKRIHLEIFDSETVSPDTLLYDSQPNGAQHTGTASRLTMQSKVVSSGRPWTLRFTRTGSLSSITDYGKVWLVLFGGTSISLLISVLFFVQNARFKALQKARELSTELTLSEQSYRNQFAANSAVMLLIDPKDGTIVEANAAAVSFYGYPREQLLTLRMPDINPRPIAEVLEILTSIQPERGQRFQFQHRLANGELRDVEASMSAIQFGGRPVFHSIVFDITERKRAEEALQRAARTDEQLHHFLVAINKCPDLDSALACLVQLAIESGNMDGAGIYLIEDQNAILRHHIGLDPALVEQASRRPLSTDYMKAALQDPHKIANIPSKQYHLDGAYGIRHGYCIALMVGDQPFGFLNVGSSRVEPPSASDIEIIRILVLETGSVFQRLRFEDRLRRINAEQRTILDTTPVGVCHLKNRKVQWANPAFERMLGYVDGESIGLDTAAFYANREDYEHVGMTGYEQLSKGESYFAEVEMKRKDGSLLWINIVGRCVDPQNQDEGSIWTLYDATERKRMLEALQESETRHSSIFSVMAEGVVVQAADGTITDCNLCAEKLLGLRRDEIKGRTSVDTRWQTVRADGSPFFGKDHPAMISLRTGRPCHNVLIGLHLPDGSKRWLNVNSEPMIKEGENRPYAVVTSFSDITERKQIMEQLQETSEQLLEAQRIARIGSYIFDIKTGRFTTSEVLDELFGIVNPGFIKDIAELLQLIHPQDRAEILRYLNDEVLKGQAAFDRYYRIIRHNDQQVRWVHSLGKVTFDDHGQPLRMIGSVQDITERKQAEEALRQSEAKLKSALASMTDAVFISDAQGKFIDFNDAFATFHRFKNKDECAKHLAEYPDIMDVFMPNGELAPFEQWAVSRALRGETVTNAEYILRRKDTGETWVGNYSFAPIRDNDGNIVGSVVTGRDITEQKRLEAMQKNLEIQNRQIQKAESLGRMAAAIAHHFNNQLQAVMMGLQMAMSDLPKNVMAVENLTDAMLSARKAAKVSSLMLTYLGQTAAKYEPLYLCEACQRQLSNIQADLPKDMVLETDLLTPGPVINANANQIQQVLTNLVTNAWEALGDTRSAIRVAVKTVCAEEIPATNRFPIDYKPQDTDYACLEVTDAGCGIAAEDMDKLFDPFFSTKFTGRGLGLSAVLGIVRAHGGCVTVESQPKRGSVFRVFLPLSAEAVLQKPMPPVQASQTGEGGTVLLVDDEPIIRKSIEIVLKRSGFTVLTAVDGVDAVEVFRKHRDEIGCVLCDLTMPRMNGWETLTTLRKLSPGFPVILSSGYSEAQVMAGDHPELPQAFLSKPYEFKTLINAIARFMRNTDQTVKKT